MIRYTLGFLFNQTLTKVLLIHKLKPDWQKGKINGLGGKFEQDEDAFTCIAREVEEESSIRTTPSEWKKIGELHSSKWVVDVMAMIYNSDENNAKSMEEQKIDWRSVDSLPVNIMSNLSWLIPMCKDKLINQEIESFQVSHTF